MKLAAGAGLAAVGVGAGANGGEALVMGQIGSAAAGRTGGAMKSAASHIPIKDMARNKKQARFEKQLNQVIDDKVLKEEDVENFVNGVFNNVKGYRAEDLEKEGRKQEKKLAARIWDYRDTLEKLGDTSAEDRILNRAKEIVDKR